MQSHSIVIKLSNEYHKLSRQQYLKSLKFIIYTIILFIIRYGLDHSFVKPKLYIFHITSIEC